MCSLKVSAQLRQQIYGLVGYPVRHSLSPLMHNAAFQALGISAEYRLFEVNAENLESFLLREVFEKDIAGFNVTIPHKIRTREILEKNFPYDQNACLIQENLYYVKLSGAVNTVGKKNDRLEYWNTDASGFLRSLKDDLMFDPKGKNILVIGCGGAGRAVIASLSWRNVGVKKIYINDINEKAIDSAKKYFSQFTHLEDKLVFVLSNDLINIIKECDLLVNATAVGMKGEDVSVIEKKLLHNNLYVYDLVYNRNIETRLIRDAKSIGLQARGGLSMLLYQGADAFGLWTGKEAPIEIMRKALREELCRC